MTKKKQTAKSETKKGTKSKKADSGISVAPVAPVAQAAAPAVQPANEQHVAQPAAAANKAPRAAKPAPAPKAAREERNGVKRPKEGGKCWGVWQHLDQHGDMDAKAIREAAVQMGWNTNNALIERGQWRRFHGLTQVRAAAR